MRYDFLIALAGFGAAAWGQQVPEGIHTMARGPTEICGITAIAAPDFEARVRANSDFRRTSQTDLYEAFVSSDGLTYSWVFATRANPAHPLATCRHVYREPDGSWMAHRQMRCDSTREACDRAFLEFQALDEEARRRLVEATTSGDRRD